MSLRKKLFVSYTRADLSEHAQAACLWARNHGWEVIDAGDIVDASTRKSELEACECLLALSARFYADAATTPSIVESDWEAARARGTPAGAMIIKPQALWPLNKVQLGDDMAQALAGLHRKFREARFVREFDLSPETVNKGLPSLLEELRAELEKRKQTRVFVIWDFTVPGLDFVLAALKKNPPPGFELTIPGTNERSEAGEIFRNIVLPGVCEADRVLVVTDRPNANVAFEAGLALGYGKPISLVHFGAVIPVWLQESAFRGFKVNSVQDLSQLREVVRNDDCWFRPPPTSPVSSSGSTLFLSPFGYVGSALREEQKARFPHWRTGFSANFNLIDLEREFGSVAQAVWCITSYSEGTDSRDGADNAANGLIFGWFFARAAKTFGEEVRFRRWAVRQESARKVVDVEVFEKTFRVMDHFTEHLVEIAKSDFRLPSPIQLEGRAFSEASYEMVAVPGCDEGTQLWVGRYPVTNNQYRVFCERTGHKPPDLWSNGDPPPNEPVACVTLADAQAFADWAGLEIPTEKIWQHCAGAGGTGPYWWGEDKSLVCEVAWYSQNSDEHVHNVGEKRPNTWGLYDVLGNLWEWTQGYQTTERPRYSDTEVAVLRANVRGGAADSILPDLFQSWKIPTDQKNKLVGFRCVKAN